VALYICCSYFVHRPFIFVRAPLTVDLAVIPPYEAIKPSSLAISKWLKLGKLLELLDDHLRVGSGWGKEKVFLHHDELLDESPFHPFLDNMITRQA